MKTFPNIEQGSLEWHQMRWGKIGGTGSSQLHTGTDALLNRLVAARMESYDPTSEGYQNAAMERGHDLEPFARKALGEYLGVEFLEFGWIQHDTVDILGMSPDGLTSDHRIGCEIKCPSLEVHVSYVRDGLIPSKYIHQMVSMFAVNPKLEKNYFCSYRPECLKQLLVIEMNRDTEVNTGTAARPKVVTVGMLAALKVALATELNKQVEEEFNRIKF